MSEDLREFIDNVAKESHLRVEADLGGGFVRLRTEEAERRQARHDIRSSEDALIELLRNSRDAGARTICAALSRSGAERRIVVVDDGCGVPPALHEAVFEARVTSKLDTVHTDLWGVHGRGMALFSIRLNAEEAFIAASDVGKGCALVVRTDTGRVPEKTDQSSMPLLSYDDDRNLIVRGPRNLNRTIVEFALAEQDACTVYAGSPVEVAAAIYAFGLATTTSAARAFAHDPRDLPAVKRLCAAADPEELASLAASIGLDMSERSARRIMDGEIRPAPSALEALRIDDPARASAASRAHRASKDPLRDARGLKLSPEDAAAFKERLSAAWSDLAAAYYLDPHAEPRVVVRSDAVHVTFPARKLR